MALGVILSQKGKLNDMFLDIASGNDPKILALLKSRGITFESFCAADTQKVFANACSFIETTIAFEWGVYSALILGAITIALAIFIPSLVGQNRKILAVVFNPTVRMVTFAVGVSICIQGVLAAYGIYTIEVESTGRYHPKLILVLGGGGVIAGLVVLSHTFSFFQRNPLFVIGKRLGVQDEKTLFDRLTAISSKLGAIVPDNVVVGVEPNFYVTSHPIRLIGEKDSLEGNTLYMSAPLCRLMTQSEFDAVIGHELGHFSGEDVAYSMRFAPAYRTLSGAIRSVSEQANEGSMLSAFAAPAMAMLTFCMFQFARVERRIGREREFIADKAGGSVGGARALATALLKIGIYSPLWRVVIDKNIEALSAGNVYSNLSEIFYNLSQYISEKEETLQQVKLLANESLTHPIDTHPPTKDRIAALGVDINSIGQSELGLPTSESAATPFQLLQSIEEHITITVHQWLVATRQVTLPEKEEAPSSA